MAIIRLLWLAGGYDDECASAYAKSFGIGCEEAYFVLSEMFDPEMSRVSVTNL